MPIYTVLDQKTGKEVTFEWNGAQPPTDQDMEEVFNAASAKAPEVQPTTQTREPHGVSGDFGTWKDVPKEALKNLPGSSLQALKDLIYPVLHPIETGKAIESLSPGSTSSIIKSFKGEPQDKSIPDALVKMIVDRYGSIDAVKKTISEDPAGFALDMSTLLTGGGTAAAKALPTASKAGKIARLAQQADPLTMAAKGVTTVAKPIIGGASQILGTTTGVGAEAIKKSLQGGKDYTRALRGKISQSDIAQESKSALNKIKEKRRSEYLTEFNRIKEITQESSIQPVKTKLEQLLDDFNVKRTQQGELDFSRSTIDRNAVNDVKGVVEYVDDWGSQPGDLTPKGLDTLKRKLDDFNSDSKNSRALVTALREKVKDILVKDVPGYQKMTAKYAQVSDTINEIEKALSINDKASIDTTMRKLLTTIKEDSEFRRTLIGELEKTSGKNLSSQISGNLMNQLVPKGFIGKSMGAGAAFGVLSGNPSFLAALLATSPRISGEILNVLGLSSKAFNKIPKRAMFQTGRIQRESKEN